jgi:hypothetical protein
VTPVDDQGLRHQDAMSRRRPRETTGEGQLHGHEVRRQLLRIQPAPHVSLLALGDAIQPLCQCSVDLVAPLVRLAPER